MLRRPRAPACALLAAALVASGCAAFRSPAHVGPFEQHEFTVEAGDAADADLHVAFWGGKLTLAPAEEAKETRILALTTRDNLDDVEPRCDEEHEGSHVSARLWIDTKRNLSFDDAAVNEWTLALGRRVPLSLELGLAACEGEAELGGVPLRRARVSLGAGSATLRFSQRNPIDLDELQIEMGAGQVTVAGLGNANARTIRITAGAGAFDIDCGGEWRRSALLHVEAGMAGVTIRVPRELAVRVDATQTTFGSVNAPDFDADGDQRFSSRGDRAASSQLPSQLSIEIEATFGSVTIVRE